MICGICGNDRDQHLAELHETAEQHYRRAERLAKDYRALTAEVIAGLTTEEHEMTAVAGLPVCRCGRTLGGGDASGAFITHALIAYKAGKIAGRTIGRETPAR